MSEWERNWRDTYEYLQWNPDTGKMEMMTTKTCADNKYREKARAKDVIKHLKEKIAKYQSWGGDYMVGKIKLLKEDLVSWEDYHKRLYASSPSEWIWFDPNLPRHFFFN